MKSDKLRITTFTATINFILDMNHRCDTNKTSLILLASRATKKLSPSDPNIWLSTITGTCMICIEAIHSFL